MLIYMLVTLAGAIALGLPWSMPAGNQLSIERAIFHAVNAGTLTGFQNTVRPEGMTGIGRATLLLLTWGGTVLTLHIGALATKQILRLRYDDRLLLAVSITLTSILTFGAALPLIMAKYDPYSAVLTASAAWGNSGLTAGTLPGVDDLSFQLLLLPLSILGGFGVIVLLEIYFLLVARRPLSAHSRAVLVWSAGIYLYAFVILCMTIIPERSGAELSAGQTVRLASAGAIDTRSAGLPLPMESFSRSGHWLLLGLMLLGATPAGTGGGLKVTILPVLLTGVRDVLARRTPPRTFALACVWLVSFGGIFFVAALALLSAQPQLAGDRVLFIAASAVSCVGLSHDPLAVTGSGLYVISLTMLAGRFVPMVILWQQARMAGDEDEILVA